MISPKEVILAHAFKIVHVYIKKCRICHFLKVFASGKSRVKFNELCHPEEVLLVRGPKIVYICTKIYKMC